jgi:hypothetical protein
MLTPNEGNMGGTTDRSRDSEGVPSELNGLEHGTILYDRHRTDCYQVTSIDRTGVRLHRDRVEYYVPCSLFVSWYGRRLFPIERTHSVEIPSWCDRSPDDRDQEREDDTAGTDGARQAQL